jgi:hypothetical protein
MTSLEDRCRGIPADLRIRHTWSGAAVRRDFPWVTAVRPGVWHECGTDAGSNVLR